MNPSLKKAIEGASTTLTQIIPELESSYLIQQASYAHWALNTCAEKLDDQLVELLRERQQLIVLLNDAKDLGLVVDIPDFDVDDAEAYRISAVQANVYRLRQSITAVHAEVENSNSTEAKALSNTIWRQLLNNVTNAALTFNPYR